MNMPDENTRQAYIDGELSVSEMTEFEKTLSPNELQQLTSEKKFDCAVADQLAQHALCPLEVWERTKALLQSKESSGTEFSEYKKRRSPSMYWGIGSLVAAACFAFLILNFPLSYSPEVGATTVEELAALSETASDQKAVEKLLAEHKLIVTLQSDLGMIAVHDGIDLLGAKKERVAGSNIIELLFACCSKPVKVIMVKRDCHAARLIGRAMGSDGQVQATRIISDDYFAAVVGTHPAHGLLDVFANQHP